ncbi:hypothetical protein ACSVC9_03260 [Clostridium sp. LBM24168]
MKRIKSIIIELAVMIVIFSIVTVADLVDVQIKDSSQRLKNIQDMESVIIQNRKQIYELGNNIIEMNKQISTLKKDIRNSSSDRDKWNDKVIEYNNKLKQRNEKLQIYNKKVNEYYENHNRYESSKGIINWIKYFIK